MTNRSILPALLLLASSADAEPASTAWLEDVNVQRPLSSETVLAFEHQLTDIKARGAGVDLLGLRLHAGLFEAFALAPEAVFQQRGEEPLRLHEVGFQGRWHALDIGQWPELMVYGSYYNDLSDQRDHLLSAGLAARHELGPLFLNGDLRPSLGLGGDRDTAFETWVGLAAGYTWGSPWVVRAGLETFAIVPVSGERMSDPTFGEAAESMSFYYGPAFALAKGPLWTSVSATTGYFVSTPASQFMLRWLMGVQY